MFTFSPDRRLIALNLRNEPFARKPLLQRDQAASAFEITIPTDLVFAAFRQLFPAERMLVFGGRKSDGGVAITSFVDVTERQPSAVHVRACPEKLMQALIDFERCGSHFALWLHSHPGVGPGATHPSGIDLDQERQLRAHYSTHLLCSIAVADGYLRFWGRTAQAGLQLTWSGAGVERRNDHVYKLAL